MKYSINKLDKRVEIQSVSYSTDTYGSYDATWTTISSVWANIQPISNSLDIQENKLNSTITHLITIRYMNDICVENRIKHNSRIFNIKSIINENEKNLFYLIYCEEKLNS